jgi:hypothetical protein
VTAVAGEPVRRSEGQETVVGAEEELLSRAYLACNGQDVDGLLLGRIRPISGLSAVGWGRPLPQPPELGWPRLS